MSSGQIMTIAEITNEEIRALLMEIIKSNSSIDENINNLIPKIFNLAKQKGFSVTDTIGYNEHDPKIRGKVQLILWDLTIEGVTRPGSSDGSVNFFPDFHVTEYGNHIIENEPAGLYDPDGYLKRITQIQGLDTIILTYLEESLKTFRIGCLLSSTVTLGCASEKALSLLIEAYTKSISDPSKREDFKKKIAKMPIKRKFEEFDNKLKGQILARQDIPNDIKENIENELNGIFSIIRRYRNDAGHPTGLTITRDEAYANLYVFPTYLRKVYKLISWLNSQNL